MQNRVYVKTMQYRPSPRVLEADCLHRVAFPGTIASKNRIIYCINTRLPQPQGSPIPYFWRVLPQYLLPVLCYDSFTKSIRTDPYFKAIQVLSQYPLISTIIIPISISNTLVNSRISQICQQYFRGSVHYYVNRYQSIESVYY